ncbi:MarR family transcriptional regulator [Clostridium frigoris]|uniref:MarR family transcriptional regulator n=1 Tax=Clostridium frigoris TaxID=205327 RepID=A0ABS6BVC7_9CLOT|nr:MarR family transcriptional regulator [Clostridium frigoris]MBU3160777.1 MarR family transcriptional regulator [Clostridium frigoris]
MTEKIIDQLAKEFFKLVPQIIKNVVKPFENVSKNSLGPMQLGLLNFLKHEPSISMTEIATKLNVSKQQLTKLTDKLVEKNYIDRVNDLIDRRSIKITITEIGIQFLNEYEKQVIDLMKIRFEKLSNENLLELREAVNSINKIMPLISDN